MKNMIVKFNELLGSLEAHFREGQKDKEELYDDVEQTLDQHLTANGIKGDSVKISKLRTLLRVEVENLKPDLFISTIGTVVALVLSMLSILFSYVNLDNIDSGIEYNIIVLLLLSLLVATNIYVIYILMKIKKATSKDALRKIKVLQFCIDILE